MNHLQDNPYALHAAQGGPEAQATLALAWEIRTLIMLEHPHIEHETITARLKEQQ